MRNAGWDRTINLRIEVVCDSTAASAIASELRMHYYDHFATIPFMADVEVLRAEKF